MQDVTFEDAMYDMLSTCMFVREIVIRECGGIPPVLVDVMDALSRVELSAPGPMMLASESVRATVDSLYDDRGGET